MYTNFRSSFEDLLRPNRYLVSNRELFGDGLYVKAASVPGYTVGYAPAFWAGREIKLAGDLSFEPWVVTCFLDNKSVIYNNIWNFVHNSSEVFNSKNNTSASDFKKYKRDILVSIGDRQSADNEKLGFKLIDAWPTSISPITLDHSSNDSVIEFEITFAFDDLEKTT